MNVITEDDKIIMRFKELYRKDLENYKVRLLELRTLLSEGKKRQYTSMFYTSIDSEIRFLGIEIRRLESFFSRFPDNN